MRRVLASNDALAAAQRKELDRHGVLGINIMSGPGAGKTSLVERTAEALSRKYRIQVIEGDIQSDLDARRVTAKGVRCIQINTQGACHLDGLMLDPETGEFIVLEVKSTYGRGVRQIRKEGPKPDWKLQTALYLAGVKIRWPEMELAGVKYLVLGRDDGYLTELDREIDWPEIRATFGQIVQRWKWLELHLSYGRRP